MRIAPIRAVSLATAALAPFFAEPSARALQPAAADPQAEVVEVVTSDKQKLKADFYVPKSRSLVPGAVLVHDAGSDRSDLDELAKRLAKADFAVLSLDLRGHGQSVSSAFDWAAADDAARQVLWASALKDLEAAAAFLSEDRRVHATNLIVVGHGAGGSLAARHALRNEDVRAIALLEPSDNVLGFDLGADLAELAGLPTQLIVTQDNVEAGKSLLRRCSDGGEVAFTVLRHPLFEDKRLPAQVAKWLADQAAPQRGR